MARILAG
jgi:hypothetical protein